MTIPKSHPRYQSLKIRELIGYGVQIGLTSPQGLIAHGRGEAYDYLLGEETHDFARDAIDAAAATLLVAKHPVISVNGNTAVLVPTEFTQLANLLDAPLEINLFHVSDERMHKIKNHLEKHGAKKILLPSNNCAISHLESNRRFVNPEGIFKADVVFVPLEDGDRTEALIKNGKKVITVDLNPVSRTARKATITIVDNIIRVMPLLIKRVKSMKKEKKTLDTKLKKYNNEQVLQVALNQMKKNIF